MEPFRHFLFSLPIISKVKWEILINCLLISKQARQGYLFCPHDLLLKNKEDNQKFYICIMEELRKLDEFNCVKYGNGHLIIHKSFLVPTDTCFTDAVIGYILGYPEPFDDNGANYGESSYCYSIKAAIPEEININIFCFKSHKKYDTVVSFLVKKFNTILPEITFYYESKFYIGVNEIKNILNKCVQNMYNPTQQESKHIKEFFFECYYMNQYYMDWDKIDRPIKSESIKDEIINCHQKLIRDIPSLKNKINFMKSHALSLLESDQTDFKYIGLLKSGINDLWENKEFYFFSLMLDQCKLNNSQNYLILIFVR